GGRAVIVDMAHNEASLLALLQVARGLRLPGRRGPAPLRAGGGRADARARPAGGVLPFVATAGDRSDELIRSLGELAARGADRVAVGEKRRYLRGRDPEAVVRLPRRGAATV